MASFEKLFDFLLNETALCGSQGAGSADFRRFVQKYYDEQYRATSTGDVTPAATPLIDQALLERIWEWVLRNPHLRCVYEKEPKDLSLSEFEELEKKDSGQLTALSRETSTANGRERANGLRSGPESSTLSGFSGNNQLCSTDDDVVPSTASAPIQQHSTDGAGFDSRHQSNFIPVKPGAKRGRGPRNAPPVIDQHAPAFDTPSPLQIGPRLYASQERTWLALTGHAVDLKTLPWMEFTLLSIIASHGADGVLQPDLTKLSGQDKRSVPHRTDMLAKKGYIDKSTVSTQGMRTSLCVHRKFLKDGHMLQEGAVVTDPELIYVNGAFVLRNFISYLHHVLKEPGVISVTELKRRMEAPIKRWNTRALRVALRRLEDSGFIKRIRARKRNTNALLISIKLLRDPQPADYSNHDFQRLRGVRLSDQGSGILEEDGEGDELMRDLELEVDADGDINDAPSSSFQHQADELVGPQWDPDRLLSAVAFDVIEASGRDGVHSTALRNTAVGLFWKRPFEAFTTRLTDDWEKSQPAHLRHLAIVRDTTVTQDRKFVHYVYRTHGSFQELVDAGEVTWEAVTKAPLNKAKPKGRKKAAPEEDKGIVMDEWGFPMPKVKDFHRQDGASTLSQCRNSLRTKAESKWKPGRPKSLDKENVAGNGSDATSSKTSVQPGHSYALLTPSQRQAIGLPSRGRLPKHVEEQVIRYRNETNDPTAVPPNLDLTPAKARQASTTSAKNVARSESVVLGEESVLTEEAHSAVEASSVNRSTPVTKTTPARPTGSAPLLTREQRQAYGLPAVGRLGKDIEQQIRKHRKATGDPTAVPATLLRAGSKVSKRKETSVTGAEESKPQPKKARLNNDVPAAEAAFVPETYAHLGIADCSEIATDAGEGLRPETLPLQAAENPEEQSLRECTDTALKAQQPAVETNVQVSSVHGEHVPQQESGGLETTRVSVDTTTPASEPQGADITLPQAIDSVGVNAPVPTSTPEFEYPEVSVSESEATSPAISARKTSKFTHSTKVPALKGKKTYSRRTARGTVDIDVKWAKECKERYDTRSEPGIYIDPLATVKKARGRPTNALLVTFKSERLDEFDWFQYDASDLVKPRSKGLGEKKEPKSKAIKPPKVYQKQESKRQRLLRLNEHEPDGVEPEAANPENVAPNDVSTEQNVASEGPRNTQKYTVDDLESFPDLRKSTDTAGAAEDEAGNAVKVTHEQRSNYNPEAAPDSVAGATPLAWPPAHFQQRSRSSTPYQSPYARTPAAVDDTTHLVESPLAEALPPLPSNVTELKVVQYAAKQSAAAQANRLGKGGYPFQRKQTILSILEQCKGLYPANGEIWRPFFALWAKRTNTYGNPDRTTVATDIKSLCADGRLQMFEFDICNTTYAAKVTKHILALPRINMQSLAVRQMQMSIVAAHPGFFYPKELGMEEDRAMAKISNEILPIDRTLVVEGSQRVRESLKHRMEASQARQELASARRNKALEDRTSLNVELEKTLSSGTNAEGRKGRVKLFSLQDASKIVRSSLGGRKRRDVRQPSPTLLQAVATPTGDNEDQLESISRLQSKSAAGQPRRHPAVNAESEASSDRHGSNVVVVGDNEGFVNLNANQFGSTFEQQQFGALMDPNQVYFATSGTFGTEFTAQRNCRPNLSMDPKSGSCKSLVEFMALNLGAAPKETAIQWEKAWLKESEHMEFHQKVNNIVAWEEQYFHREPSRKSPLPEDNEGRFVSLGLTGRHAIPRYVQHGSLMWTQEMVNMTKTATPHSGQSIDNQPQKGTPAHVRIIEPDLSDLVAVAVGSKKQLAVREAVQCKFCRIKKAKCSGFHPCHRCRRLRVECVYPRPDDPDTDDEEDINEAISEEIKKLQDRTKKKRWVTTGQSWKKPNISKDYTLAQRITGLTGERSTTTYTRKPTSKGKTPQDGPPKEKTIRAKKSGAPSKAIGRFQKLLFTLVIAASMSDGDSTAHWRIVSKVYSEDSGFDIEKANHVWDTLQRHLASQINELTEEFQERFLQAYEAEDLPEIDDFATYNWPHLVEWALKTCRFPNFDLPTDPADCNGIFNFIEESRPDWERKGFRNMYMPASKQKTKEDEEEDDVGEKDNKRKQRGRRGRWIYTESYACLLASPPVEKTSPRERELLKAKSWIRSNAVVPESSYDRVAAHIKLTKLDASVLSQALDDLVAHKILRQSHIKVGNRNWEFSASAARAFNQKMDTDDFMSAVAFKKRLDEAFANPDVRNYSLEPGKTLPPGGAAVLWSLVAAGRVQIVMKLPDIMEDNQRPDAKEYAMETPRGSFRPADAAYPNDIVPTETYLFGNPLNPSSGKGKSAEGSGASWNPLLNPPMPDPQDDHALIPVWCAIDGTTVIWAWWERVLKVIIMSVISKPGISVEQIARHSIGALEIFEIEQCIQWLEDVGAVARSLHAPHSARNEAKRSAQDGVYPLDAWYAVFGDALREEPDDMIAAAARKRKMQMGRSHREKHGWSHEQLKEALKDKALAKAILENPRRQYTILRRWREGLPIDVATGGTLKRRMGRLRDRERGKKRRKEGEEAIDPQLLGERTTNVDETVEQVSDADAATQRPDGDANDDSETGPLPMGFGWPEPMSREPKRQKEGPYIMPRPKKEPKKRKGAFSRLSKASKKARLEASSQAQPDVGVAAAVDVASSTDTTPTPGPSAAGDGGLSDFVQDAYGSDVDAEGEVDDIEF